MKLGFIGTGNMASAIMGGIISKGVIPADEIIGADLFAPGRERVKEKFGIHVTADNNEVVEKADVVLLSVKPQFYADVISGIKDKIRPDQIVITIAPGKTLSWLAEQFGKDVKIVRCMPNTPAMVGEGMSGVSYDEALFTDEEKDVIDGFFTSFGKMEKVDEKLMDVVGSASGCSPAYVYMFIEALADGCVKNGLPRQAAYKMVAQAVLGSAKMVLETGKHPGELKDMVCSPGGTTIEGLAALEENGFRGAIIKACDANFEKNKKLKG